MARAARKLSKEGPRKGAARARRALPGALLVGALVAASCGDTCEEPRLLVFAAASTADVVSALGALGADPQAVELRASFGPSSALARQILDGAPADVFLSASGRWVRELVRAGVTHGEPLCIARNRVVCVVPSGSELLGRGIDDAAALVATLSAGDLVAIADEGVPVGEYTRQSLAASGEWQSVRPRLVGQLDARDCLRAVQSAQAVAGFVYATDARLEGVETLFELDPRSHDPVEVWAVATSERPEARAFLTQLVGARAREVLLEAGFTIPGEAP